MQILKEKFIQLTIRKQIQFGICAVTFCVFILVTTLLLISSFVIVNIIYTDMINNIEQQEARQITEIMTYTEIQVHVSTEFSKLATQLLRNYIENNDSLPDFRANILENQELNTNLNNYFDIVDSNRQDEILANNNKYSNTLNMQKSMLFLQYYPTTTAKPIGFETKLKYFRIHPMISNLYNNKLFNFDSPLYSRISIFSITDGFVYFYPSSEVNAEFNYLQYMSNLGLYYYTALYSYYVLVKETLFDPNSPSFKVYSQTNPYLRTRYSQSELTPYDGNPVSLNVGNNIPLVNTISISYNPSLLDAQYDNYTYLNNMDPNFAAEFINTYIDYAIVSHWSLNTVDDFASQISDEITGVIVMACDFYENILFTLRNCYKLIKLFDIANNLQGSNGIYNRTVENPELAPVNFTDCFIYPEGKSVMLNDFLNDDSTIVKRKKVVPLMNEFSNNNGTPYSFTNLSDYNFDNFYFPESDPNSKRYKHKVYKATVPTLSVSSIFESFFISNFKLSLYIIKGQQEIAADGTSIQQIYNGITYFIIFYNLIMWTGVIIIILIILHNVTNSLTKPIIDLTNSIFELNSGKNQSNEKKKLRLEKIVFPDDTMINELFKICKNLIKGGFNEDFKQSGNARQADLKEAENLTKLVKFNNYIIQENFIMSNISTQSAAIFNYVEPAKEKDQVNLNHSVAESVNSDVNNSNTNKVSSFRTNDLASKDGEKENRKAKRSKIFNYLNTDTYEPEGYFSVKNITLNQELRELMSFIKTKQQNTAQPNVINEMFKKYTNNGKDLRENNK